MPFFGTVIHWFFSWFPARSQASKNSVCTTQFYTKNCLHKTIVTQNNFYICLQNYKTQPLQRTTYTEHDFYTKQRFRKTGFTWTAVTQHKFYTKNRLYTQRNLYSTQRVSGPLGVSARYTFVFMFVSWYWGVASQAKWPGENMVGWELERKNMWWGKSKFEWNFVFFANRWCSVAKPNSTIHKIAKLYLVYAAGQPQHAEIWLRQVICRYLQSLIHSWWSCTEGYYVSKLGHKMNGLHANNEPKPAAPWVLHFDAHMSHSYMIFPRFTFWEWRSSNHFLVAMFC